MSTYHTLNASYSRFFQYSRDNLYTPAPLEIYSRRIRASLLRSISPAVGTVPRSVCFSPFCRLRLYILFRKRLLTKAVATALPLREIVPGYV